MLKPVSIQEIQTIHDLLSMSRPGDEISHGYCILFDIVDSTAMKTRYSDWKQRFVFFYESFTSLIDRIHGQQNLPWAPVVKFLGDAAFAYLPLTRGLDCGAGCVESDLTTALFREVCRFRAWLAGIHPALGIRVRTVVSHVNHIQLVQILGHGGTCTDALGQGIDFTFRLEKFADERSICMNTLFRQGLALDPELRRLLVLETHRAQVKGWYEAQDFWVARERVMPVGNPLVVLGIKPKDRNYSRAESGKPILNTGSIDHGPGKHCIAG